MYDVIKQKMATKETAIAHAEREPMCYHTSFKIGGNADIMAFPKSIAEVEMLIKWCKQDDIPYFILGRGTNILVSDKGIEGIVIKMSGLQDMTVEGTTITVQCGANLSTVANVALKAGLSGMEFASGIPGTVGGAVFMNAGAYGGEMCQIVRSCRYITAIGEIKTATREELEFSYRTSRFSSTDDVILEVSLELVPENPVAIKEKMDDFNNRRKQKQPLDMPSAGSTFKRPPGFFAGQLIEECGLRGFSIGGAQVSQKHCGFVVNTGNATCQDVVDLIKAVSDIVYQKKNVHLMPEVRVLGRQ